MFCKRWMKGNCNQNILHEKNISSIKEKQKEVKDNMYNKMVMFIKNKLERNEKHSQYLCLTFMHTGAHIHVHTYMNKHTSK